MPNITSSTLQCPLLFIMRDIIQTSPMTSASVYLFLHSFLPSLFLSLLMNEVRQGDTFIFNSCSAFISIMAQFAFGSRNGQ
uniref:Uncharacterized protein n=1 Tax=Octopus bimaculoides TaxID=37653 RepID=A0A0L8HGS7_OCTBM